MATLNTIARTYADELRDEIAWVIIWKTGRSWNAEAVWLNCDDDTLELEDLEMANHILEWDPKAVMLNGYYCGHFGEDMTINELVEGIRWHYENGCNLLKDSDVFPPEPIERPAELPADMPWYGRADSEGPDPYVYDGYMSPEDCELLHRRMEADRQKKKPPNTDALIRTINAITEACERLVVCVNETVANLSKLLDAMLHNTNNRSKWWHLYKHARKLRTRKKYRRMLMRQFIKLASDAG